MIKLPNKKDIVAKKIEEIINGRRNLLKLIPLLKMAIISELFASLLVKKTTDMKINNGENRFAK
tara:strand:+ start:2030 stop:2221 length:192 start_codon:yes stop_codon:yes gene_type:complete